MQKKVPELVCDGETAPVFVMISVGANDCVSRIVAKEETGEIVIHSLEFYFYSVMLRDSLDVHGCSSWTMRRQEFLGQFANKLSTDTHPLLLSVFRCDCRTHDPLA